MTASSTIRWHRWQTRKREGRIMLEVEVDEIGLEAPNFPERLRTAQIPKLLPWWYFPGSLRTAAPQAQSVR
jgi:hypothetical protein